MKLQSIYDVGIYCRLSRDDSNSSLESMSIANQRQLLTDFVKEKGWNLIECYIDDGWTGGNFQRPDFQRMLRDVEAAKINCVVVKDLSRLGRNYVQAGYYTEEYFVERGIRFIAINDAVDTMQENSASNDLAAFHHVLNEIYPRQVSKKVRQVKRTRAQQGMFMNSQAPYGFIKSPQDKHVLIEDEEAANIVRRIFNEYAAGDSARKIGDRLNSENIDSPRSYHYKKKGRENVYPNQKNAWGSASVMQILRNQAYIGNMIQGRRQVISFKTKKVRCVDPSDWIIVENTHTPLVSRELWDRVHSKIKNSNRVRETKKQTVGLFSSILKCANCGSPLAYMRKKLKTCEKGVYRCSRYNNHGGQTCSSHYIDEADICSFVLSDIRQHAILAANERQQLANRLLASVRQTNSSELKAIHNKIRETEIRLSSIMSTLTSLYEDKCAGKLPETVFLNLMGNFSKEQAELEERLPRLRQELESIQETTEEIDDWLSLISQYMELETLDRATVMELIESITVSERVKKYGERTQELEIKYRFIGNLPQDAKKDIG